MQAIEGCLQWMEKYELEMLRKLNCSHNCLADPKYLTMFYLPRLEVLDLFEYRCAYEAARWRAWRC